MLRGCTLTMLVLLSIATTSHANGVLFQDKFNNGMKRQWIHDFAYSCTEETCTWEVIDGVLHGYTGCSKVLNDLAVGDLSWRNYSISVDLTSIDAINRNVAIYYRAPLDYFNVNLRANYQGDGGRMFFTYSRTGPNNVLVNNVFHSVPFPTQDGVTYRLELGIFENLMFAKIDGELVTTYDIGAFLENKIAPGSGGVALRVFSGGGCSPHEIAYDNVVVRSLRRSPLSPNPRRHGDELSTSLLTPNPVRDEAIIQYSAPGGTPVSLLLFDVRGRLVRTAFQGQNISSGLREWKWDLRDDMGQPVASGVYYHRLESKSNYSRAGRSIVVR